MTENYKITKEIGLRILELRQEDGLTFPKMSAQIKAEFDIDLVRSSIERFYKNVLKGNSRILPKDVVNVQIKSSAHSEMVKPLKQPSLVVKKSVDHFEDVGVLAALPHQSGFNEIKRPSDELLSLFNPKPR